MYLLHWLAKWSFLKRNTSRQHVRKAKRVALRQSQHIAAETQELEDRIVLDTLLWLGGAGTNNGPTAWSNVDNWFNLSNNNTTPKAAASGDSLIFDATNTNTFTTFNDVGDLTLLTLDVDGGTWNFIGGPVGVFDPSRFLTFELDGAGPSSLFSPVTISGGADVTFAHSMNFDGHFTRLDVQAGSTVTYAADAQIALNPVRFDTSPGTVTFNVRAGSTLSLPASINGPGALDIVIGTGGFVELGRAGFTTPLNSLRVTGTGTIELFGATTLTDDPADGIVAPTINVPTIVTLRGQQWDVPIELFRPQVFVKQLDQAPDNFSATPEEITINNTVVATDRLDLLTTATTDESDIYLTIESRGTSTISASIGLATVPGVTKSPTGFNFQPSLSNLTNLNIGSIVFANGVTVQAGSIELRGDVVLDKNATFRALTGDIDLRRSLFSTDGLSGLTATTLIGDVFLGDGEGVNDTFNTLAFLTVNAAAGAGNIVIDFAASSVVNPSITTSGTQTYNGIVTIASDTVLQTTTALGNIIFNGDVNGVNFGSLQTSLQLISSGDKRFNGNVLNLRSIVTGGGGTTTISAANPGDLSVVRTIRTSRLQQYNDVLRLGGATFLRSDLDLEFLAGIQSEVPGVLKNLELRADVRIRVGNGQASDAIVDIAEFIVNQALSPITNTSTIIFNVPNAVTVTTTGRQLYNANGVLEADTSLVSTGGDIAFNAAFNSSGVPAVPRNFTITTPGNVTVGDGIGAADNWGASGLLQTVTINAALTLMRVVTANNITPTIRTFGNQVYNSALRSVFDTVLTSVGSGNLTFNSTIDAPTAADIVGVPNATAIPRSFTVNSAGNKVFNGRIGGIRELESFSTNGPGFGGNAGTVVFAANGTSAATPSVLTRGLQRYGDAVQLGQNVFLNSRAGNVVFISSINSASAATPRDLVINVAPGGVSSPAGTTPVSVDFGDGSGDDSIGSIARLNTLIVNQGSTIRFNIANGTPGTPSVTTVDTQQYNGNIVLRDNTVLVSGTGNIVYPGTVTGPGGLTVIGQGDASLSGVWYFNGRQVRVLQDGNVFTFINEFGGRSTGLRSGSSVTASGWGNLTGNLDSGAINWANGSTWRRLDPTGTYVTNGLIAKVEAGPTGVITFTNEFGGSVTGSAVNTTQIVASGWGNLSAVLDNSRINWANGAVWTKIDLSPTWTINGAQTRIEQVGANFRLINENGQSSAARFFNATTILATDWGITGVLDQGTIRWANGTAWGKDLQLNGKFNGGNVEFDMSSTGITLSNENGTRVSAQLVNAVLPGSGRPEAQRQIIVAAWGGIRATFNNGRLLFTNGSVWDFGDNTGLNAVFSDLQRFPFG